MQDTNKREITIFICFSIILVIASVLSLSVGKYHLSIFHIVEEMDKTVFYKLRLPRTVMAIMAGAGLGLAGAVYQKVFKNPLASPDIIGISSGANLGAAVMIVLAGGSIYQITIGSFLGAIFAVACVLGLVKATRSNSTSTYVLSGIIISAVANSMIMLLKFFADNEGELATIEYWTMGSLSSIALSKVTSISIIWIVGFVFTLLLSRQVDMLNLNDDEARALGTRVKQVRLLVLGFSTLLVSSIICLTGLISFAGLIAPHIANLLLKRQSKKTFILSALVGASVLLVADILCRTLASAELPLSVLTTLLGVPVLVIVMIQRKRSHV